MNAPQPKIENGHVTNFDEIVQFGRFNIVEVMRAFAEAREYRLDDAELQRLLICWLIVSVDAHKRAFLKVAQLKPPQPVSVSRCELGIHNFIGHERDSTYPARCSNCGIEEPED